MNRGDLNTTSTVNGAAPLHGEESGSDQDSSSSVSSMSSDEIESHFVERFNRRFHSPGSGSVGLYPFPVDDVEGQRLSRTHELIKELMDGRNYWGPALQTLAAPVGGERRLRVLDVCTGNGNWVDEMAVEFPHVKVYGLDIVPLATRYPAENVQFEIHDINTMTRWIRGRFDLVHMRQVYLSPINYSAVLHEVARILRPGGVFLAGEWLFCLYARDGASVATSSNGVTDFFHLLSDSAAQHQLFCNSSSIPQMLTESAYYEDVVAERHVVSLDGSLCAERTKRGLLEFADAVQYFLLDSGILASRIEDLCRAMRRDLNNAAEFSLVYLTVHARRKVDTQP